MAGFINKVLSLAGIYDNGPYAAQEENDYDDNGYYQQSGYADEDADRSAGALNQKHNGLYQGQAYNGGAGLYSGANSINGGGGSAGGAGGTGTASGVQGGAGATGAGNGGRLGPSGTVNNVVNFRPQTQPNYTLVSAKPDRLEDAQLVCDHLKDRHVVIVNVEGLEGREAQRIVDFIGGSVFALDGEIFDITNRIFAVAPNNVDLIAIKRDSKSRGFLSFANGGSARG